MRIFDALLDLAFSLSLSGQFLSGVTELARPIEDARRLFMADALLNLGVEPAAVVKALGIGPSADKLGKYNPDQPRVAPGNGRESGRGWRHARHRFEPSHQPRSTDVDCAKL